MPNKMRFWAYPEPAVLVAFTLLAGQAPLPEPVTDLVTELGKAVYDQLKEKGEIVEASPLYDSLRPIAKAISQAAQPRYNHPFNFFLVHEPHPNAFATPGGNVYVVDSLLYFVKNTEQLAGTLCHEVSHTIHRDAVDRLKEQQRIERREIGIALLLGPSLAQMLAIQMIGDLHSLAYSRDIESRADVASDANQVPQLLSDHPAKGLGSKRLSNTFLHNTSVFSKFDSSFVPMGRNRSVVVSRYLD